MFLPFRMAFESSPTFLHFYWQSKAQAVVLHCVLKLKDCHFVTVIMRTNNYSIPLSKQWCQSRSTWAKDLFLCFPLSSFVLAPPHHHDSFWLCYSAAALPEASESRKLISEREGEVKYANQKMRVCAWVCMCVHFCW